MVKTPIDTFDVRHGRFLRGRILFSPGCYTGSLMLLTVLISLSNKPEPSVYALERRTRRYVKVFHHQLERSGEKRARY